MLLTTNMVHFARFLALYYTPFILKSANGHGFNAHDQHKENHGNLRNLDIFEDSTSETLTLNTPCNDDDPVFTIGGTTYACVAAFHQKGGRCGTPDMTPEQLAKIDEAFLAWDEIEEGARVDWSTSVITIPTYFHVIHSGNDGRQFTYASNPAYIKNQIKIMNNDFRGDDSFYAPNPNGRSYNRFNVADANAKIQFCLAEEPDARDNPDWYPLDVTSTATRDMKRALRKGGMESLNVYVTIPQDQGDNILGFATFPDENDLVLDGVIIMNESMPNSSSQKYGEGDTLPHETGHWLNLAHTHQDSCAGPGDYMNLAPPSSNYASIAAKELDATFDCPVNEDDCVNDSGKKNPIHSFMSYAQDNCMDQFTPGQIVVMHQAWEMYRHKSGYSERFSLAEDGYSCKVQSAPTPTPKPTNLSKPTKPTKPTRPIPKPKSGKNKKETQAQIDTLAAEPTSSLLISSSFVTQENQEEPLVHTEDEFDEHARLV